MYEYVAEESEEVLPPISSLTKDQLISLYDGYEEIFNDEGFLGTSADAEREAVKSLIKEVAA